MMYKRRTRTRRMMCRRRKRDRRMMYRRRKRDKRMMYRKKMYRGEETVSQTINDSIN